jgi:predicted aspartyl protease
MVLLGLSCVWLGVPFVAFATDGVPDLTTLRARMVAGEGKTPDNYRETVTWKLVDGSIAKEQLFRLGADRRAVTDIGGIRTEAGEFKGDHWHQDKNGLTVVDLPDPLASAGPVSETATLQAVSSPAPLFVISDVGRNGLGSRHYVDTSTYRLVRDELIGRGGTTTTTYDGYATFGAQTLPTHWTRTTSSSSTTFTRTERVPGAATAADVAIPAIRGALVEFPGTTPVEIPTKFYHGRVYVRVTIAGRGYDFLLDSGASTITINADVARQLGLSLINRRVNSANAQATDTFDTIVPEMKIGQLTMHHIVVNPIAAPEIQDPGMKPAGLLGFDFFATVGVTIDYEHQRVTVAPTATYVPPAGPDVMPLEIRLGAQQPMVEATLDGVSASRFVVDTGDSLGAFTVFDYFMDRHPNVGFRSSETIGVRGVGGAATARGFSLHSFRIGTYNFVDFTGNRMGSGSYSSAEDGLIGVAFLDLFTLDFDYPHGMMYFTPTTKMKQLLRIH